jgi:hypothetical protein
MKKLITVLLLFIINFCLGQSFEGVLTYKVDFEVSDKMKKMGITKEVLVDKMNKEGSWSDTIKISYRQGDYFAMMSTIPKSWMIYSAKTNKIYTLQEGEASDICAVTDASIDLEFEMTGKRPVITKLTNSAEVNGVTCEIVSVKWQSGTYQYFYNPADLIVDPALFEKHIYDGWAEFLKIAKALPVQIIKETPMGSATLILVHKESKVIDKNLFDIPELKADEELNFMKLKNMEMMRIVR